MCAAGPLRAKEGCEERGRAGREWEWEGVGVQGGEGVGVGVGVGVEGRECRESREGVGEGGCGE